MTVGSWWVALVAPLLVVAACSNAAGGHGQAPSPTPSPTARLLPTIPIDLTLIGLYNAHITAAVDELTTDPATRRGCPGYLGGDRTSPAWQTQLVQTNADRAYPAGVVGQTLQMVLGLVDYHGPGTYGTGNPYPTDIDFNGISIDTGVPDGFNVKTVGPETIVVNADGHSGTIDATIERVSLATNQLVPPTGHVSGKWAC